MRQVLSSAAMATNRSTADSHTLSAHRHVSALFQMQCRFQTLDQDRKWAFAQAFPSFRAFRAGGQNKGSLFSSGKEESWHRFPGKVENLFPSWGETFSCTERILEDFTGIKSFRCWALELLRRGSGCRHPPVCASSLRLRRFTCLQAGLLDYARGNSKSLSED